VFGERVAVRPDGLRLSGTGPGNRPDTDGPTADGIVSGTVTTRTFRRDHFVVGVGLADRTTLHVSVAPEDVPEPGDVVRIQPVAGALVPLP